jgi:hypothetical protein
MLIGQDCSSGRFERMVGVDAPTLSSVLTRIDRERLREPKVK